MKKLLLVFVALLSLGLLVSGCSKSTAPQEASKTIVKVGATALPHAEILAVVKPLLATEVIDLQIIEMTDYVTPNIAVAEKIKARQAEFSRPKNKAKKVKKAITPARIADGAAPENKT